MRIIAVGRKTLAALAMFGLVAGGSAFWARSARADGCGCATGAGCGCGANCGCPSGDQGVVKAVAPAGSDAKPAAATAQTTCPILGGKINKKVFTDYDGKRVYFCCTMCIPTFQKDPAKYVKKMEDAGIVLDKTPAAPAVPATPPAPKS